MKHPVIIISFGLTVLLAVAGSVMWGRLFAAEKVVMTVQQAKQLIAEGENMSAIPKDIWRQLLTPEQYDILWQSGTEKPFTGDLLDNKQEGVYITAGCQIPVFRSEHKYESGTGWPSFWDIFNRENIVIRTDWSLGIPRKEVLSKCGEHLGHVFRDGPDPTGLRYCINSDALLFRPAETLEPAVEQEPH